MNQADTSPVVFTGAYALYRQPSGWQVKKNGCLGDLVAFGNSQATPVSAVNVIVHQNNNVSAS